MEKTYFVDADYNYYDACDGTHSHTRFVTVAQNDDEAISNVKNKLRRRSYNKNLKDWDCWVFFVGEARSGETVELKD